MCPVYLCIKHGLVPRSHADRCSKFRSEMVKFDQRLKNAREVRLEKVEKK